jgi:Fur family zinc uptake transcriptional regulator
MEPLYKLKSLLRNKGYSVTKPRLVVFKVLIEASTALSVSQIINKSSGIDMVSVYRTLDLFEKIGVTHRVWTGFKSKIELSETFSDHHHHFTCLNCNKTISIESNSLENLFDNFERQYDFSITQHSVELSGQCSACQLKL